MDFFIDFALLGLLIIAATAFLGSISRLIVSLFVRKNKDSASHFNDHTTKGWKKVEGLRNK
jgi:hypothetical protein